MTNGMTATSAGKRPDATGSGTVGAATLDMDVAPLAVVLSGTLRTDDGTSGRGACRATSSSTCRLLRPAAAFRRRLAVSSVRWGATSRTVVRLRVPSPREAQDLRAIGEERREARREMEISGLELREMGHKADRRFTPGMRQASESFGQLDVREMGWCVVRHGP